jgi:hypothetical protein
VRAVLAALAVGALVVAGMRVLAGVQLPWAVLLGVPVTAFTLLFLLMPVAAEAVWAPLPEPPRLASLALVKLRRAGIDELHDPRAPDVLGAQLHRLVTDPNATMPDPRTAAALFASLAED